MDKEKWNSIADSTIKGNFKPLCDLINEYYQLEGCGGNLHIVLDDGNFDSSISWCKGRCDSKEDEIGSCICNALSFMGEPQIDRLYNNGWKVLEDEEHEQSSN